MKLRQFGAMLWTLLLADGASAQIPVLEEKLQTQAEAAVAIIDGTVQARGLRTSVRVQRDRWGVAHIYAKNEHDLFFAQGFIAAQDRLFQMEIWKRSGQGRLAEILGPAAVERDINARRLRYRGDLKAEFASYAPMLNRSSMPSHPGSTRISMGFRNPVRAGCRLNSASRGSSLNIGSPRIA